MRWNEEQSQLVKDLWPTHSASLIAQKMANHCDEPITRNSVMGKAYRLHLTQNGNSKGAGRMPLTSLRGAKPPKPREKFVRIRPPPAPAPKPCPASDSPLSAWPCTIIELDNTRCHWPLGPIDEVAVLFCGGEAAEGFPYCPHHIRIAYHH
jgi:GcrA cell cycle regulator